MPSIPPDIPPLSRRLREASIGATSDLRNRLAPPLSSGVRLWLAAFAIQDRILFAYLLVVAGLLYAHRAFATHSAHLVFGGLLTLTLGCLIGRAADLPSAVRASVYRVAIVGVLLGNYLMLRDLLPIIRPDAVDDLLIRLDIDLFHVEPTLWLQRLNHRPIVEWFSFFYFSYFLLDLSFMVGVLWVDRLGRHTTEFAIGVVLIYCAGQLGYMAVPAYGPVRALASRFAAPLHGGLFWGWVSGAVATGGAMKDAFPSLHTAAPLWFTRFAFVRARSEPRWRWPARITAFFAANICCSTLVLRWHYAVDVLAGMGLWLGAHLAAPALARAEEAWRARRNLPGPWCFDTERERGGHN